MDIADRYIRNEQMLSHEENLRLRSFRVAVAGCGGLGGYIIEMLARMGIGQITAIDGDVFEPHNLNRQLFSLPSNLGSSKAIEAKRRIAAVNSEVKVVAVNQMLNESNAKELLQGHDIICDALDNVTTRKIVARAAADLDIPMVFGAIAGWYAQVGTIMPGNDLLDKIYPDGVSKGAETQLGNPAFTPALAASLQLAETIKVLLGKPGVLKNKLLVLDILDHQYDVISFD
jgi:molybdopterin-synthase adenylyltransferase